ncbi:MAG: hypothetical protein HQK87_09465, partial [Nitrospinae bacterium]|nr:hypothetical protein [Nitrospinota bacterium]
VLAGLCAADPAVAIPAFSKKYEAPCSLCHEKWPRLTDLGMKFKLNAFQMPDSEDGGETDKLSPRPDLFLDIGGANPPLSVILEGGVTLLQSAQGPEGRQSDKFLCCVDGSRLSLVAAGTVAPNIGYFLSGDLGKGEVTQAVVKFANFFSPGLLAFDLGAMKVVDNDVVADGREWFGSPEAALFGHPRNPATAVGRPMATSDTGVRVYGRPGFDMFTYEFGAFTGAAVTDDAEDDNDLAYTFMGRFDIDRFAMSLRWWTNNSGLTTERATLADGTALAFAPDPRNPDERSNELYLSARYRHPTFALDFALDRMTWNVGSRSAADGAGTLHTWAPGGVVRIGGSVGVIWYAAEWFQTGLQYALSRVEQRTDLLDGAATPRPAYNTSLLSWRLEARPVSNLRMGLEAQFDLTGADARLRADGTTFDPQNQILFQWDLAL